MPTVMFVCEGNRARSQMAEGFFNAWAPPGWRGESGGTKPKESVLPAAIDLMAAVGIDIRHHRPKKLDLSAAAHAWRVIAMCEIAACPVDVADKTEHWDVIDPAELPPGRWHEVRDEISGRVKDLIAEIRRGGA